MKKDKKKTEQTKHPEQPQETEDAGDYGLAAAEAEEDNAGAITPPAPPGQALEPPPISVIDREITFTAPVIHGEMTGYKQSHIEISKLTIAQADTVRRLSEGLMSRRVALNDGRKVASSPDALRWLIEQVDKVLGFNDPVDPVD